MKFLVFVSTTLSLVGFAVMVKGWWSKNQSLENRGLRILAAGVVLFMVLSGTRELFPRW
jgi:hypothetical protein